MVSKELFKTYHRIREISVIRGRRITLEPYPLLAEGDQVITRIAHTALIVREYDEAIHFYCGKLGFTVAEDTQLRNKRWIRLRPPGGEGCEILLSKAVTEKQQDAIGNQTGGRVLF